MAPHWHVPQNASSGVGGLKSDGEPLHRSKIDTRASCNVVALLFRIRYCGRASQTILPYNIHCPQYSTLDISLSLLFWRCLLTFVRRNCCCCGLAIVQLITAATVFSMSTRDLIMVLSLYSINEKYYTNCVPIANSWGSYCWLVVGPFKVQLNFNGQAKQRLGSHPQAPLPPNEGLRFRFSNGTWS